MRKLLAVKPVSTRYGCQYRVSVAHSFREARLLIAQAEQTGEPFDDLDIPVSNEAEFWEFLDWMRKTGRNYPFSVFGCEDTHSFWKLCEKCRAMGFRFNT